MKKAKHFSNLFHSLLFLTLIMTSGTSLNAQSCNLLSGNINLGGNSHDLGFQTNDDTNAAATLSNGNFVVAWETRDDVDGNENGGFFQVFSEDGTAITNVMIPYNDINPNGTGDQGTPGPKVVALITGFVIVWESEDGPGDTGPVGESQQDVYFRIYNNEGSPITGSTRVSMVAQEDQLEYVLALSTGGFVVLTSIDQDVIGNNKDDYFFQAFNASGVSISGDMVNISGGAHDESFQTIDRSQAMADLGGGVFVVAWEARQDADGDDNGGFFRIFNENGTSITDVMIPYADINPSGTGVQGTPGPKVIRLLTGNFVISWESRQGPGDLGPGGDDNQDIYYRIYSSSGTSVTGTLKANSDNTADEEQLDGIIGLTGGNFAILYHADEDDTGNNDDYFVRSFTSSGAAAGASVEISDGGHTEVFSNVQQNNQGFIALNNGNFAVGWAARDGADGDEAGIYYRVFNAMGTAVSAVVLPYQDINAAGTGNQSSSGPILKVLPDGFTVVWHSKQGPGDVGPAPDDQQDIYHRVIDNEGTPYCGTTKTNTDNDAEEELLKVVQALLNGNFIVIYKDDEDETGNKDDYFVRVIGGAPLQNVCPTLGTAAASESAVCINSPFDFMVTNLQNMAMSTNNEQDYGLNFVAFADPAGNPYIGGTLLGSVAFGSLTDDSSAATLTGITINVADSDLYIYAILDTAPSDDTCLPFAQAVIEINAFPSVTFTATVDALNIDEGVQNGIGGGLPSGGIYSGVGVTDSGDGMTYSFDPMVAGIGEHLMTYSFTDADGCNGMATDIITVSAATPGNDCSEVNDINTLFGQMLAEPQTSGLWDNTHYTSSTSDPTTGIDCFFNGDGLQHTIWYTFTGDGNTYNIKTIECNASNYISSGDTQMAIYSGSCGDLTPVACSEDEDGANNILNVNLDLLTEAGVVYYIMMDGFGASVGEFCVQVTMTAMTPVTQISDTNIELFPNPTSGKLMLKNVEAVKVEIFDNTGRIVLDIDQSGTGIDISMLMSGIYFLKIYTNEKVYSAKVVKE